MRRGAESFIIRADERGQADVGIRQWDAIEDLQRTTGHPQELIQSEQSEPIRTSMCIKYCNWSFYFFTFNVNYYPHHFHIWQSRLCTSSPSSPEEVQTLRLQQDVSEWLVCLNNVSLFVCVVTVTTM